MKFKRTPIEQIDVNLTPLIDVVFLLLIFFMVSTTFTKESHLQIDLPSATAQNPDLPPQKIDVVITADGKYSVNEKALETQSEAELKQVIQSLASGNTQMPFIINADAKTPHQAVITVMDVARQLGFGKISFATQKTQHPN